MWHFQLHAFPLDVRVVRAQAARLDAVAKDPDLQLAAAERLERIVIKVVPDVAHVLYMYLYSA